jgi:hypothetical protein
MASWIRLVGVRFAEVGTRFGTRSSRCRRAVLLQDNNHTSRAREKKTPTTRTITSLRSALNRVRNDGPNEWLGYRRRRHLARRAGSVARSRLAASRPLTSGVRELALMRSRSLGRRRYSLHGSSLSPLCGAPPGRVRLRLTRARRVVVDHSEASEGFTGLGLTVFTAGRMAGRPSRGSTVQGRRAPRGTS